MLFVLTFEPAVQTLHCDHSFRSSCRVELLCVHDFSKRKKLRIFRIFFYMRFENTAGQELIYCNDIPHLPGMNHIFLDKYLITYLVYLPGKHHLPHRNLFRLTEKVWVPIREVNYTQAFVSAAGSVGYVQYRSLTANPSLQVKIVG